MTNSDDHCTDRYLVGDIDAKAVDSSNYFQPRLVFCKQFWGTSSLGLQMREAIGHPNIRQARFDLGYISDNQGKPV